LSLTKIMKTRTQIGFTLVEIAIVMFIMALILGTGLTLLSAQQDQRKIEDTASKLNDAREALIGFALAYGRLPCPADPTIASGTTGAGQEAGTCTTTSISGGILPWATLGVSETDAWGRRFSYQVTNIYADTISSHSYGNDNNTSYTCDHTHLCTLTSDLQYSSFALCSCGGLTILSSAGGSTLSTFVPAVIVSHGINGLGAYLPSGQRILPVPATTTNEGENSNIDDNFVSRPLTSANETGGYFDDQVVWLSPNILFNRMVQAGKLP